MQKKMRRTVLSLLLAVLCFVGIGYPAVSASAEEDTVYQADYGNGWTISSDGVLTLNNVEGWKDYLVRGRTSRINKLIIGKDLTYFFLSEPEYDGVEERFGFESFFVQYNEADMALYEVQPFTLYLFPKTIEVAEGNPVFSVKDGLLINQKTHSLVLAQTDVKHVVIPDGIKTIETGAFCGRSVETVSFPDSLVSIGTEAFYGCNSLKQVTLPDSLTTIRPYAFAACEALEKISLPDSLQYIGAYAFKECAALREADLPDGLTHLGTQAFEKCRKLQDVVLPNSLAKIGEAVFFACILRLLVLPERLEITNIRDEEIFTFDLLDYIPNRTFGKSAVNTLVFTGSNYSYDTLPFYRIENVYFLEKPPKGIGEQLDEKNTTNIYCTDEHADEWNDKRVAQWMRDKIVFMPMSEMQAIIEREINATPDPAPTATPSPTAAPTPRPTATPKPTLSPTPALTATPVPEEPTGSGVDPVIIALGVTIALAMAAVVFLAMKGRGNKKRKKKSNTGR